jgi:L-aspartate oxidase
MEKMIHVDVAIMGSGIAGLSLVNYLKELTIQQGKNISLAIIAKGNFDQTNTNWAQGGIAAVSSEIDSFESHIEDTMVAGVFVNNKDVVEKVVTAAPEIIKDLIRWGMDFDKTEKGDFDLVKEGGHRYSRIWHHKDATGAAIQSTLSNSSRHLSAVSYYEYNAVVQVERDESGIFYLRLQHTETNELQTISAANLVLAGGGIGALYAKTTNQPICTGDAIYFAKELGATIKDLCFVQFHPTGLYGEEQTTYLITEAIRGAGGILRDKDGNAFMVKYDQRADLAPRDIVARAIFSEMKKAGTKYIFLDATALGEEKIKTHFPSIHAYCLQNRGIDIAKDWIPVVPTQHYLCGGIEVNSFGESSVEDLYAIGECANTGLHGANRLASNSLLEAVYFAKKAAINMLNSAFENPSPVLSGHDFNATIIKQLSRHALQQKLSDYAGIIKNTQELKDTIKWVNETLAHSKPLVKYSLADIETNHMYEIGLILLEDALLQKKNIGVHFNEDL